MTETTTSAHRAVAAAAPSGARLGDRLRLLRVAAGLTQTELAGDRFSKEYVSQIERGKTRPTAETVEWLAQRLNVDPTFLSSGVSTDERSRVEALLARAEALSKGYRYKEAVAAYSVRAAVSATNSVELDVRARSGEAWARLQEGDVRTAIDLPPHRAGSGREDRSSRMSTAPRSSSGSVSPGTSLRARRLRSRCSTRHSRSPRAPTSRATGSGRISTTGAPAAIVASATSRPRARTSSMRSSWRRASTTAARWRTPTEPRSSRSAPGTGCSPAQLRGAGQVPLPGARRRAHGGPAAEQPRRPQPPAREAA